MTLMNQNGTSSVMSLDYNVSQEASLVQSVSEVSIANLDHNDQNRTSSAPALYRSIRIPSLGSVDHDQNVIPLD